MCSLKKAMVILLLLGGFLMPAQAGTTLGIGATVSSNVMLTVLASERSWVLDPDLNNGIFTETLGQTVGISVKTNKPIWNVNVNADQAVLTEYTGSAYGTKTLASSMSIEATPVEIGTTSAGKKTVTTSQQLLWGSTTKKGNNILTGLVFTQPVSYNDEPLATGSTYRSVLTFTLSASIA
jgi:hypothetical protein